MKKQVYMAPMAAFNAIETADVLTTSTALVGDDGVIEMKGYDLGGLLK